MHAFRCRFHEWSPEAIECLAYSPDRKWLALARGNGDIEIYSGSKGHHFQTIRAHSESTRRSLLWAEDPLRKGKDPNFSLEGYALFSISLDGEVAHWDLRALSKKGLYKCPGGTVYSGVISPSGKSLALACEDGTVRYLKRTGGDGDDGEGDSDLVLDPTRGGNARKHTSRLVSLCFHGEATIVAGSTQGRLVRLTEGKSGQTTQQIFGHGPQRQQQEGPRGPGDREAEEGEGDLVIWAVCSLSPLDWVASGDSSGTISIWDLRTNTLLQNFPQTHRADVLCLQSVFSESFEDEEDTGASDGNWKSMGVGPNPKPLQMRIYSSGADGRLSVLSFVDATGNPNEGFVILSRKTIPSAHELNSVAATDKFCMAGGTEGKLMSFKVTSQGFGWKPISLMLPPSVLGDSLETCVPERLLLTTRPTSFHLWYMQPPKSAEGIKGRVATALQKRAEKRNGREAGRGGKRSRRAREDDAIAEGPSCSVPVQLCELLLEEHGGLRGASLSPEGTAVAVVLSPDGIVNGISEAGGGLRLFSLDLEEVELKKEADERGAGKGNLSVSMGSRGFLEFYSVKFVSKDVLVVGCRRRGRQGASLYSVAFFKTQLEADTKPGKGKAKGALSLLESFDDHSSPVDLLVLSGDRRTVLALEAGGGVRAYGFKEETEEMGEEEEGRWGVQLELPRMPLGEKGDGKIACATLDKDGRRAAVVSSEGLFYVFDLKKGSFEKKFAGGLEGETEEGGGGLLESIKRLSGKRGRGGEVRGEDGGGTATQTSASSSRAKQPFAALPRGSIPPLEVPMEVGLLSADVLLVVSQTAAVAVVAASSGKGKKKGGTEDKGKNVAASSPLLFYRVRTQPFSPDANLTLAVRLLPAGVFAFSDTSGRERVTRVPPFVVWDRSADRGQSAESEEEVEEEEGDDDPVWGLGESAPVSKRSRKDQPSDQTETETQGPHDAVLSRVTSAFEAAGSSRTLCMFEVSRRYMLEHLPGAIKSKRYGQM
uniref:Uncharacterized protein n=1 Tax=Chromera velia CCMP2878 TaxID=1169474 RepID=A0A0G4FF65_9ALVE|eukprot:Cvel_3270.t1-p1 / transcript=Cvel_3270.t1 / gene=Cvel_3270 / organism=Chromera_velia_CCMP2878 / gene_product=Cirhin, putative / transcript_product=Cirhin, putative / location=Cvel_scaffold128:74040-82429(+) / protein_length=991 / sequence_SO=supercontig / SO=protein_coding / is_pseudo=false